MQFAQFFGKLHLLVLHLPIGILILAFLMELAARRTPSLRPAIGLALFWGMLAAVLAAVFGYLLSLEGGYEERLLNWHKWTGFATAGLSVGVYFLHKKSPGTAYRALLVATVAALGAAGHLGGSLTHGEGFLWEKNTKSAADAAPIANLDSAEVFSQVVLPVLKDKCGGCHNPSKRKGDLVLLTQEGILAGGESGPAFLAANPAESPLLLSIHLPTTAEKHMPPKGKQQLSEPEKQLIDWWVKAGMPVGKTVAQAGMPAVVKTLIGTAAAGIAAQGLLDGLQLSPVSESKLKSLREKGLPVYPLANESPFLQVLLSGKKDLDAKKLQLLNGVAENIVQLNLSRSNVDDAMLAAVAALPNLNRLYLDQTAVTDKGLTHLAKLGLLEYLNLYGTKLTDVGLATLQQLPNLKSVYVWQTGVTEAGVAQFLAKKPGILFEKGMENDSLFGEISLKPPVIKASKELFTDTLAVVLEAGFGKPAIHFTLDGSEPDSTSAVYEKPLLLNASSEVKALARKDGWPQSSVVGRSFVKVRHKPANISLAQQPDPRYAGKGASTLADFVRGTQNFKNGEWLGFEGKNVVATIDLGQVQEVSKLTFGALQDVGGWIFYPKGLRVSTSIDGQRFQQQVQAAYPVVQETVPPSNQLFSGSFKPVKARYLKVEVFSVLKNPAWHPGAGKPCWVFVDELVVE